MKHFAKPLLVPPRCAPSRLARACRNGRCPPQGRDREIVRGRLSKARRALQGSPRPSRTRLSGGEDRGKTRRRDARARVSRSPKKSARPDWSRSTRTATAPPSWCAPNSMRCRWKRRPVSTMQAATRPPGTARRRLWRIAAATTSTWRTGSERRRRCRPEGPVAGHVDVHRATGRRNRCGRHGDAG